MSTRRNCLADKLNRDLQKDRLRRNVISNDTDEGKESSSLSPKVLVAAFLIIIILGAAAVFLWFNFRFASDYDVVWERELDSGSSAETFKGYLTLKNGMLRYSKDGAQYILSDGSAAWERSYQMNNPVGASGNDFAVIYDQGGSSIYIFNDKENTGIASTLLPIRHAVVSDTGIVYAVLNDETAEYITAFRKDGEAVDLSVKSILTGDGYPVSFDVSPDGTELITSYLSIEDGDIVSKIIFRNFGEIGQNADSRRIVGGFTGEVEGKLPAKVNFSTNQYSQAFYDGGIVFFSTKVLTSPEVVNHLQSEDEMLSIAYSASNVAAVYDNSSNEKENGRYRAEVYNLTGRKLCDIVFDYSYTGMELSGRDLIIYSQDQINIYDISGRDRAKLDISGIRVSKVVKGSFPGEYLVTGGNVIEKLRLK